MNQKELLLAFFEGTARTWHDQGKEKNLFHAALGLVDEAGEIASALKKKVGYGKELDKNNILEECGDWLYFFVRAYSELWSIENLNAKAEVVLPILNKQIREVFEISILISEAATSALYRNDYEDAASSLNAAFASYLGFIDSFGFTLEQVINANEAKLKARYPEKWTAENATNRDKKAERDALDKHLT